jgi:DNA-binding response OmpR family regulator
MRKHLVLFVQPEIARHFDFMKLYDSGLITDWVRDPKQAEKQLTAFVDVVVLDLSHGPDECLAFCRHAKLKRADRIVVLLRAESVIVPDDACFDLVLPAKVGQDEFVRRVSVLLDLHRKKAAS